MPRTPTKSPSLPVPHCPRCGYDLQGQVDAWNTQADGAACPCQGVCSECGLTFAWVAVFRPHLAGAAWFVETDRPRRRRWSWFRTSTRLILPWRFWQGIGVETPIVWRRTLRWLLIWFLVVSLGPILWAMCMWGTSGALLYQFGFTRQPALWNAHDHLSAATEMIVGRLKGHAELLPYVLTHRERPPWLLVGPVATLSFVLVFMLLPTTRKLSKVRAALVWRASAYSVAWALAAALWGMVSELAGLVTSLTANRAFRVWGTPPSTWYGRVAEFLEHNGPMQRTSRSGDWLEQPYWIAAIPLLWLSLYWLCAMKQSWRMKDWLPAWLSCVAVAVVASFLALLTISDFLKNVF
jgi:hypothetical protein